MEIADYIVAEDRELVSRTLGGDDTAFEYLFNRYRDAIHRQNCRYCYCCRYYYCCYCYCDYY